MVARSFPRHSATHTLGTRSYVTGQRSQHEILDRIYPPPSRFAFLLQGVASCSSDDDRPYALLETDQVLTSARLVTVLPSSLVLSYCFCLSFLVYHKRCMAMFPTNSSAANGTFPPALTRVPSFVTRVPPAITRTDPAVKRLCLDVGQAQLERLVDELVAESKAHVTALLVLVCLLGTVGNLLVVLVSARRRKQSSATVCLTSLATVDLLICGVFVPHKIYQIFHTTYTGAAWCKVNPYFMTAGLLSSTFLLDVIAVDRYRAVCRPLRYCTTKKRWTFAGCAGTVLLGFALSVPNLLGPAELSGVPVGPACQTISICLLQEGVVQRQAFFVATAAIFFASVLMMVVLYAQVFIRVRASGRSIPGRSTIWTASAASVRPQQGDSTPCDSTPCDSTPCDSTPRDSTPCDSTPRDSTPCDSTPCDSTPCDSTPCDSTPCDSTPCDSTPRDSTPRDSTLGDSTPRDSTLGDSTPRDSTPRDSSPRDSTTDGMPNTLAPPRESTNNTAEVGQHRDVAAKFGQHPYTTTKDKEYSDATARVDQTPDTTAEVKQCPDAATDVGQPDATAEAGHCHGVTV
ncbi:uncharacterized protein LOC144879328 [Branchiostoma floridae x Branchiostoma japonicum]